MKKLRENITNLFGSKGKTWLDELPMFINKISEEWHLKNITPVENMTYNYVAKAIAHNDQPVVLKISCDEKSIDDEKNALEYFNGDASIRLLNFNKKYNALLLQQAIPGVTLKSFYPAEVEFVIDCYVTTIQKLHTKTISTNHQFRHVSDWLQSIDKVGPNKMSENLLHKAILLKNKLLATLSKQIVLHGDLHHDNILKNESDWIAIDPKGIIGEPEFEVAAFDFMHDSELENEVNIQKIFTKRTNVIAKKANLNAKRIQEWVFVRLILSAVWSIEDNGDPRWAIKLANQLNPIINV